MAASTRSGVLTRPSRSTSSPRPRIISRTWCAMGCTSGVAGIVDIVAGGLPESDAQGQVGWQRRAQLAPDHDGDVLGRGIQLGEPRHVHVEVLVIEPAQHPILDEALELG